MKLRALRSVSNSSFCLFADGQNTLCLGDVLEISLSGLLLNFILKIVCNVLINSLYVRGGQPPKLRELHFHFNSLGLSCMFPMTSDHSCVGAFIGASSSRFPFHKKAKIPRTKRTSIFSSVPCTLRMSPS